MNLFSPAEELLCPLDNLTPDLIFGVCPIINHELCQNFVKVAVDWHIFGDMILPSMKSC